MSTQQITHGMASAMQAFTEHAQRVEKLYIKLLKERPALGVSAYVVAGDMISAEEATERVRQGQAPTDALVTVGSYSRFQWAVENLSRADLLARLPDLWCGSDPDDTKPAYLILWQDAFALNRNRAVLDGKPLPRKDRLTIYRGQGRADRLGIAWTLDRVIAEKFQRNQGMRSDMPDGVLLRAVVKRKNVLAYITGRNESEVIVDPSKLKIKQV